MTSTLKHSFTLRDILQEQSRDLYDAETKYLFFLSELKNAAENKDLREEIATITSGSRKNIADLESVCAHLGVEPEGVPCAAMGGLLREAKDTTREYLSGSVKDAALIADAQRIAHYEIAGFGTAKAFASQLKISHCSDLFEEMLKRAAENDRALTKLATGSWLASGINNHAAGGD